MKRIGIYSGAFNPVHVGHVGFALQALQAANLDVVYFLPERRPRHKQDVEHYGHRVAMLRRASRPHRRLKVLELPDVTFSVQYTLPRLRQRFRNDQLVFLAGSDTIRSLPTWPHVDQMLGGSELIVGLRAHDDARAVEQQLTSLTVQPTYTLIESYAADVSSRTIRESLRQRKPAPGLLKSVERYSNRHWLYVSLAQ